MSYLFGQMKFKTKFTLLVLKMILLVALIPTQSLASASHPDGNASHAISLYDDFSCPGTDYVYLNGWINVSTRNDYYPYVDFLRAYMELYRDGTYLGSTEDREDPTDSGVVRTAAGVQNCYHLQLGLYEMDWAARIAYEEAYPDYFETGTRTHNKTVLSCGFCE